MARPRSHPTYNLPVLQNDRDKDDQQIDFLARRTSPNDLRTPKGGTARERSRICTFLGVLAPQLTLSSNHSVLPGQNGVNRGERRLAGRNLSRSADLIGGSQTAKLKALILVVLGR